MIAYHDKRLAGAVIQTGTGDRRCDYYVRVFEGQTGPVYGVRITQRSGGETDTAATPGLSASYEAVAAWVTRLAAGTVLPMTLIELADDWLASYAGFPASEQPAGQA